MREYAEYILGFEDTETVLSGTGQVKTFNQPVFMRSQTNLTAGISRITHYPAIILEAKATDVKLEKHTAEFQKNCNITATKYKNVVGILYNGYEIIVFKNEQRLVGEYLL